ncbi:Lrp/AsnC family transcriptional regulator [Neptunomonas sp. XY-337]|uniref:Lrp/AsnC family transcriptional regulator n=1 Tax=Neptunomonas sp. XY-337 TaxID=2561897 RepID=UPI0010AA6B39|nr:Lrp/AsnC family transcriptional regulator [Neptunomonas sp. XY-337]
MDSKDQKILSLLAENARIPASETARAVHLARTTVNGRIKRLEQKGIIQGYKVRLDNKQLQRPALLSRVAITVKAPQQQAVLRQLESFSQVYACETISGSFDIMLEVRTQDTAELDWVIEKVSALNGVESTESAIVLREFFRREV